MKATYKFRTTYERLASCEDYEMSRGFRDDQWEDWEDCENGRFRDARKSRGFRMDAEKAIVYRLGIIGLRMSYYWREKREFRAK